MSVFTHRTARAAGAATIIGAIVLASPLFAASDQVLAKSSSQQAMASSASEPAGVVTVEARIKDLHNRLHITAAQKPQWDNLTQVMRENVQAMVDLEKQRPQTRIR
jgi:periplasmic protein CpxP/Spy